MADWRYPEPAATWPTPYEHRTNKADPTSAIPGKGNRMKVLNGRDRHAGQVGRVRKVTFDGGELVVRLAFDDGTTGEYWADELLMKA